MKKLGDKWSYANVLVEDSFLKLQLGQDIYSDIAEALETLHNIHVYTIALEGIVAYATQVLEV